jgi:hypothetical protein
VLRDVTSPHGHCGRDHRPAPRIDWVNGDIPPASDFFIAGGYAYG